jgi:methyl-coenzyme M reductase beta subunit
MAKYKETIDLYDDEGKLLKSGVTLEKISPLVNPGMKKIIDLTKRTVAVNFAGIDEALKTGKVGGKSNQILGRTMKVDCVKDNEALTAKIKAMVEVTAGDNTKITKVGGGKMILVEVPTSRLDAAATYDAASTAVAAATTYALVDQYKVDMRVAACIAFRWVIMTAWFAGMFLSAKPRPSLFCGMDMIVTMLPPSMLMVCG